MSVFYRFAKTKTKVLALLLPITKKPNNGTKLSTLPFGLYLEARGEQMHNFKSVDRNILKLDFFFNNLIVINRAKTFHQRGLFFEVGKNR